MASDNREALATLIAQGYEPDFPVPTRQDYRAADAILSSDWLAAHDADLLRDVVKERDWLRERLGYTTRTPDPDEAHDTWVDPEAAIPSDWEADA